MDNNLNIVKRRASDSTAIEALALISSHVNRIPPPLPYLPSDYQPSPDSPRQIILSSHPVNHHNPTILLDSNANQSSSGKRQRSRSIGYPLAIESNTSSTSTSLISNNNFELVPYREWTVIARNNQKGQLVLYNQDNQSISVQNYVPDHFASLDPNIPVPVKPDEEGFCCPYCHRPIITATSTSSEPDYMDRNYFRLLASSQANTASNSPTQSRSNTFSTDSEKPQPLDGQNLNANAFNQGYYSKFFVELNRLGKGFRGSVFLCEHMLDGVKLGKYAVKKVAIGNNHPWLVRMLREVHLLERLRHPNVVSYKHSWLEYNRLTAFGPEVPCLFILMECANGGNLEEYFELKRPQQAQQPQQQQQNGKKRRDLKRERIRKQYQAQEAFEKDQDISAPITQVNKRLLTMTEIWSLFLDIVQGLAHLHQQNIVHRDLKPPNLLLQYDIRNRNAHQGIPRILISDFGECEDLDETHFDENRTGATGTLEFMAPEHVRLDPRGRNTVDYSPKADMWSLGMVLYYLCYSRLPYSVIDDVDILRSEILSFKEIKFPASRFDIYHDDPELYNEAFNDPNMTPSIPHELKLLIRMLLSVDPNKRPSCNEILSKLKSLRRDLNAHIFQDVPTEWQHNTPPSTSGASASSKRSFRKSPSPVSIHGEEMDLDRDLVHPITEEERAEENIIPTTSSVENTIRKRQRLLGGEDRNEDIQMSEIIQDEVDESSRLLIASPDITVVREQKSWITDDQSAQLIKTMTAVLKISSCTFSCSPYSAKPLTLYPVIFFAMLDFWTQSSSPSLLLLFIHITWIMLTTLITGGLCEA